MTVWEVMEAMNKHTTEGRFFIYLDGMNITGNEPVLFHDVKRNYEERSNVIDALEKHALFYDTENYIIYART